MPSRTPIKSTVLPLSGAGGPPSGLGDPPAVGAELTSIREKAGRGERLTREDGLALYACPDLLAVGLLASWVARRRHGRQVCYVRNGHLNYSNYCTLACAFCSFCRRRNGDSRPGGYELSLEEVFEAAGRIAATGATELHVVGGLHPDFPFAYYVDLLRGLRARYPHLGLKCFTAIEVYHFAGRAKLSPRETLSALREAGLDTLPGGGAEVLDDAVRARLCPGKESAAEWLELHRQAHRLGLRSNATLLHGHVETAAQRVEHLLKLRELQDETGGFLAFVPLPFHPREGGPALGPGPSALAELREHAVARLLLDNFAHVKAYWVGLGVPVAQLALNYGASDLDGTVLQEKVYHLAGARTPQGIAAPELERLIREARGVPVERDHLYRPIRRGSGGPLDWAVEDDGKATTGIEGQAGR